MQIKSLRQKAVMELEMNKREMTRHKNLKVSRREIRGSNSTGTDVQLARGF